METINVAQGEEIVISEAPRQPGRLKDKIHMADDFDAPLPEALAAAFRGDKE